jgi:AsmA protein
MRASKIAGGAIAALVVIVILLLIIGIPSGFLTSEIQSRVQRETGYRLTISGATKIGIWPSLNVSLHDIVLQDPKDSDRQLTADSIQADITLSSLWSGHPRVTELAIVHPVLSVPLQRDRLRDANPSPKPAATAAAGGTEDSAPGIEHVTVSNGTVVFSNLRDRVENRIEAINADMKIASDRNVAINGSARTREHPLKFQVKAVAPAPPLERQNIPAEFTLDAPGLLQAPLSGKAEARLNGSVVMINGLTGTLGDGAFNGWASIDFASKPLVKLDLDFQRLDIAAATNSAAPTSPSAQNAPQSSAQSSPQTWSNASFDLTGLNYVDVQAKLSAAELDIGSARLAPAAIDANLGRGVLRLGVTNLGAYGGLASAELDVDASTTNPTYSLRTDLAGVRALPLLRGIADFDRLDGKLQAKIAVRSIGTSQRAIMSNLEGSVFAIFQDGAIRGINVAGMIRSLTSSTLSGWQDTNNNNEGTDLTQLSMSFHIDKGQATTTDLNLVGPLVRVTGAGTIDLGTKLMAFRVEPKLVMTTEGQGRAADPVGFGIPVMIDGSWANPRIYPDMAGIMDNPDAAYAKLRDMGKGLFGPGGAGLGQALGGLGGLGGLSGAAPTSADGKDNGSTDQLGGQLGQALGSLLQQGVGRGRSIPPPAASSSSAAPASQPAPVASNPPPPPQDSQPMNDVLRQLFNR